MSARTARAPRRAMAWEAHQHGIASTYEHAKSLPTERVWEPLHALKRQADAAVHELARFESAYEQTARGLAAFATVTAYLQATRTGLSVTEASGFCVLEQDGTRLHCAATIAALADWCRTQKVEATNAPTGGFRDYMAREWIA
jgi:hypothetical protein